MCLSLWLPTKNNWIHFTKSTDQYIWIGLLSTAWAYVGKKRVVGCLLRLREIWSAALNDVAWGNLKVTLAATSVTHLNLWPNCQVNAGASIWQGGKICRIKKNTTRLVQMHQFWLFFIKLSTVSFAMFHDNIRLVCFSYLYLSFQVFSCVEKMRETGVKPSF